MPKVTNSELVKNYIDKLHKILDNDVSQEIKDIEIEDLFISLINDVISANEMFDFFNKVKGEHDYDL